MDVIVWIYALVSVLIVSLVSLIGIFTLSVKIKKLERLLLFLVSFSAGTLLGGALFHLLPEAFEEYGIVNQIPIFVVIGILVFFVLEKYIHWRHCHIPTTEKHPHSFAYMNLIGDAFHNLIDGFLISGTYLVSIPLGITTTIAILLHEIPQEIGDFGVLVHGGFSIKKALKFNFISALAAFVGAIIALLIGGISDSVLMYIIAFTAGSFIYISVSDLLPELRKNACHPKKSYLQLIGIILGLLVMYLFLVFFG